MRIRLRIGSAGAVICGVGISRAWNNISGTICQLVEVKKNLFEPVAITTFSRTEQT